MPGPLVETLLPLLSVPAFHDGLKTCYAAAGGSVATI